MANNNHLAALARGVASWNEWRREHEREKGPNFKPDLSNADLSGWRLAQANLRNADLSGSDLSGANLKKADIRDSDLSGAKLIGANLEMAKLARASLHDALLPDVDLSSVAGLIPEALAGADLTRSKLPSYLTKFEDLERVQELSKNAGALFVSMMAACAYSWLTIKSTTDIDLILNSGVSKLPIIQTEIPIVSFYSVAPYVLLGIFLYFHLYLQRLWEAVSRLPSVFPDGMTVDRKTYSWILTDLSRSYLSQLRNRPEPLFALQKWLSISLIYCLVPLILFMFWRRYLVCHDIYGTVSHVLAMSTCVGSSIAFYHLAKITLEKNKVKLKEWMTPGLHPQRLYLHLSCSLMIGIITIGLSNFGFERPVEMSTVFPRTYVSVVEQDVSKKPENWTEKEYAQVRGASLYLRNLVGAHFQGSFLAKADFTLSDLRRAYLTDANLSYSVFLAADLRGAYLNNSNLRVANLRGADLRGASLQGAEMRWADCQYADLRGADLTLVKDLTVEALLDAKIDDQTLMSEQLRNALKKQSQGKQGRKEMTLK